MVASVGADGGHLEHVAQQADGRQRDHQPQDRGDDGQRHRRGGAEGEQQDHHRGRQADHLAADWVARLGHGLAHVAAGRRVQARVAQRLGGVDDLLGVLLGQVGGPLVEEHRDVRRLPVLAQRRVLRALERVGGLDHARHLAQRGHRVLDRLLGRRVGELALVGVHHHRVGRRTPGRAACWTAGPATGWSPCPAARGCRWSGYRPTGRPRRWPPRAPARARSRPSGAARNARPRR